MRVLYITDGGTGGVSSHVRCLTQCLKGVADVMVCIAYRTDALKVNLDEDGTPYVCCDCKSGHDWRLFFKVRSIVRDFNPDVVHFHDLPLLAVICVRLLCDCKIFVSRHTPSSAHPSVSRLILNWIVEPCYWLPVSAHNWKGFKAYYPNAKGEVFYNPMRIGTTGVPERAKMEDGFVVGMVGRYADQKDWPSFCKVAQFCRDETTLFWGVGVEQDDAGALDEGADLVEWKGVQANGRDWIGKFDLFVMTSKHEELPTTVLECFLVGTPICGFIPTGGMTEILAFSTGALREVFTCERDCGKLAQIVMRLKMDADLRHRVVEDGWQILTQHFDAEKNVRGRLLDLYRGVKVHG